MKDKLSSFSSGVVESAGTTPAAGVGGSNVMDAISALCNLGYNDPVAREALTSVKRQVGDEKFATLSVEEMIREGLKALA